MARETGLLASWVEHHVAQVAGRPCPRCDGTGFAGVGVCFRCGGSGGKASHAGVTEALAWVRGNVSKVRRLGEQRDARAPAVAAARRQRDALAVAEWKRQNHELWKLVEDMLPCDFKYSMIDAIENRRVTPRQEAALRKLVESSRRCDAPAAGSEVEVRAVITGARNWVNSRHLPVFRIDFWVAKGWGGRIETTDPEIVSAVQGRRADEAVIRGPVTWSKDTYAILSGRVEIDFRMG